MKKRILVLMLLSVSFIVSAQITPPSRTTTLVAGSGISLNHALNTYTVSANAVTQTITLTGAVTGSGTGTFATSLGSFSSSDLSGALTNETGSGLSVFGTSPTLLGTVSTQTVSATLASTATVTASSKATVPTVSTYSVNTLDAVNTTVLNTALANVPSLFTQGSGYAYLTSTTDKLGLGLSTAPSYKFAVKAASSTDYIQFLNSSGNSRQLVGIAADFAYTSMLNSSNTETIRLITDPSYPSFIGGKLGVGQLTASFVLDVKAQSSEDYYRFTNSSNTIMSYYGCSGVGGYWDLRDNSSTIKFSFSGNSALATYILPKITFGTATVSTAQVAITGILNITPISATAASALTPSEGDIVIVNTINGTFLVEGLYSYANGAWRK